MYKQGLVFEKSKESAKFKENKMYKENGVNKTGKSVRIVFTIQSVEIC